MLCCTQALLQDVSRRAEQGKWDLAGSLASTPPGQACAQQAVFRVADAGSRTLLAGIQLTNNLQVLHIQPHGDI
jgi:hypothetical protein